MAGYTDCACDTCFEIAIGKQGEALCCLCEEAGCDPSSGLCYVEEDSQEEIEEGLMNPYGKLICPKGG